jgi:hypothetical protein
MVLALTVALLDASRRPLIEGGRSAGSLGPTVRVGPSKEELLGSVTANVPDVVLPVEDRPELAPPLRPT